MLETRRTDNWMTLTPALAPARERAGATARVPVLTPVVTAAAVLVTAAWGGWLGTGGTAVAEGWLATSEGVAGQPWRLALGPLLHADVGHLLRDLPVFAALAWWLEKRERRLPLLLLFSLVVPTAFVLHSPGMDGYLGLSGAINALLVVVVGRRLRAMSDPRSHAATVALAVAFGGKLLYEGATGHLLFPMEMSGGVVAAPLAHLVGAGVGGLWLVAHGSRAPVTSDV
jgi:membrane associated rhomboid family serine protease